MKTVFGFDLGTNSIGWSVLSEAADGTADRLVDAGVRIFNKAVEDKTPTPKNLKRRQARLARRVLQRRVRRRRRLERYLVSLGFLPPEVQDISRREAVLNALGDPYVLRARALTEALAPHELGRIVTHLGMRRGFLSNRKALLSDMLDDPDVQEVLAEDEAREAPDAPPEDAARAKEEGEFKAAISALQAEIDAAGLPTLGAYLARLPASQRKRNRRIGREMIRHELDLILQEQTFPALTDAVREEIAHIIFHQRPLRQASSTIGQCSLEPNRRRAAAARLEFQRMRLLQDINHLRYDYPQVDPHSGEIHGLGLALSAQDRNLLMARLDAQRSMTWSAVKTALGLPRQIRFNLEEGSKKGLGGNSTACAVRAVIGDSAWEALRGDGQHALVEDLLKFEKKSALKARLIHHWAFDVRTAVRLATKDLEPGHCSLSLKAIRRLLPHLEAGMIYSDARIAAGYGYEAPAARSVDRMPRPADLRNPVVNRALHEFRRVCNALVATHGKPAAIRIELPRDLTMNAKARQAFDKQQKENLRANEEARTQYETVRAANPHLALPDHPRHDDRLKYRLWKEQGCVSIYSGKAIGAAQLFSAAVEIDHILPYSRSLDDSYMNKVLAFADENRDKGKRTPWEAYGADPAAWEQILQRCRHLPRGKRDRLLKPELDGVEGFINSQLTDTAYISRQVKDYIQQLGCDVSVSKGRLTAWLRHRWGLNALLGGDDKKRDDHRHHVVDAAVTAAVNRSLYARIVHLAEEDPRGGAPEVLRIAPPYQEFRADLAALLEGLIVSHDPVRKLAGALHEETGYRVQPNGNGSRVTYRKALNGDFKQLDKIVDPALRDFLAAHLERFEGKPKVAFSDANRPRLSPGKAPIRHVRIVAAESFNEDAFLAVRVGGQRVRLHPLGNNHHVEVLRQAESGKFAYRFVTTWQAAQRARRKPSAPLVDRTAPDGHTFLMALHINDLVEVHRGNDWDIYRVQNLDSTDKRLVLRLHTAATLDHDGEKIRASLNTLLKDYALRLLQVNVLGKRLDDQADR